VGLQGAFHDAPKIYKQSHGCGCPGRLHWHRRHSADYPTALSPRLAGTAAAHCRVRTAFTSRPRLCLVARPLGVDRERLYVGVRPLCAPAYWLVSLGGWPLGRGFRPLDLGARLLELRRRQVAGRTDGVVAVLPERHRNVPTW
jgi:hypothetical protein